MREREGRTHGEGQGEKEPQGWEELWEERWEERWESTFEQRGVLPDSSANILVEICSPALILKQQQPICGLRVV